MNRYKVVKDKWKTYCRNQGHQLVHYHVDGVFTFLFPPRIIWLVKGLGLVQGGTPIWAQLGGLL